MILKNILILFFSIFLTTNIQAQIYWLTNTNLARSIAKSSGRLIVMDFWASWCGPCKEMDKELWVRPELQKISKNFIALKINVDLDKSLVSNYKVTGIPMVIITTSGGDVVWEKGGYDNAESFLQVLEAIPENAGELNKKSLALAGNNKDPRAYYSVGLEFQNLGKNIKSTELKNSFFNCSELNLKKALKLCNDPVLAEEIELNSILNDVYNGRTQKALKMIENKDDVIQNDGLTDLRHFILAKCYLSNNDQDNFQKEKQQIKKKEFLDQLKD